MDLRGQRIARERQLRVRDSADQPAGESARRLVGEPFAHGGSEPRAESCGRDRRVQQLGARAGLDEHAGEQVVEVENLDTTFRECIRERVVLLARTLHPEDVVEEEIVLVAGA